MLCLICRQANTIIGFTSIPFDRDEFKILINHVPVEICPNCGEAIVDEEIASHLLNIAENIVSEGIIEVVCDYN